MSIAEKYLAIFVEQGIYHVYNRTNNKEPLFRNEDNYHFFLNKYLQYLGPFVSTYCYNLLPNHFHLVIRIKPVKEILLYLQALPAEKLIITEKEFLEKMDESLDKLIESAFHRFFTSYSMAFNKAFDRKGNLFHRPFKRVRVEDDSHLFQLIIYVHTNKIKHRLSEEFTDDKWSSYLSILSTKATALLRKEVLNIFGGAERYVVTHGEQVKFYYESLFTIED